MATPVPVTHYNPVPTPTPKPIPTATPKPIVTPTVTPNATATAAATCPPVPAAHVNDVEPAPSNPWCYDFDSYATVANEILNPPANFCSVMTVNMSNGNFHCNANFAQQTGFVVLCHDDAWARAPHHADADTACKDDGGYEKDPAVFAARISCLLAPGISRILSGAFLSVAARKGTLEFSTVFEYFVRDLETYRLVELLSWFAEGVGFYVGGFCTVRLHTPQIL
jgi:hypothetical protein